MIRTSFLPTLLCHGKNGLSSISVDAEHCGGTGPWRRYAQPSRHIFSFGTHQKVFNSWLVTLLWRLFGGLLRPTSTRVPGVLVPKSSLRPWVLKFFDGPLGVSSESAFGDYHLSFLMNCCYKLVVPRFNIHRYLGNWPWGMPSTHPLPFSHSFFI